MMDKWAQKVNRIIEHALVSIFGLLVLDVLWQVISRYFIGSGGSFTEELARFSLIWLTILGAAYLNGQRGHLAMDFLLRKLPDDRRRSRSIVIEILMMVFAIVVMIIGGGMLVYSTLHLGQRSSVLQIPLGCVYSIVPLSGLLIVFFGLNNIAHFRKSTG